MLARLTRAVTSPRQFSTSVKSNMKVVPIQARSDNWMYLVVDDATKQAAVVDPFDAPKMSKGADKEGVKVTTLITTHHHYDHSGGNEKFLSLHPGLKAYGGSNQAPGTNTIVKDGSEFKIGSDIEVKCYHTPCHTQDSICFYVEDKKTGQRGVFTGDTLFLGGCGRFFEGTPEEMHAALTKLGKLPDDTVVYNGHEYTKGSAKFGLTVEPDNEPLKGLLALAENDSCTTGKSTIGDEKQWNVFMRLGTAEAKTATGETDPVAVMGKLREMKNAAYHARLQSPQRVSPKMLSWYDSNIHFTTLHHLITMSSGWKTPQTDPEGWRLVVGEQSHGQHKWVYLPPSARDAWPQDIASKYWSGMDTGAPELSPAKTPLEAARNGLSFYSLLQNHDGHFASEYGGPLFLTPGLVIAMQVTGQSFSNEDRVELIRYLLNKRRPEGGWGLHTAAPPTVFGTVMNYVALRLLGMGPDEGPMTEIRALIHKLGGATGIPSWGKMWLSILGVYEYEGMNPVPPELWLLPDWVPFAPWRWWIHVRDVVTPMSYLYGVKFKGPVTPMVYSLRQEIYTQPYESIKWSAQRNNINPVDIYSPHHPVFAALYQVLNIYESLPSLPLVSSLAPLRKRGIEEAYKQVVYEDENTTYQTIGPVSKAFNMIVRYHRDGVQSEAFKMHLSRVPDFLWLSKDGLFMTGTNGSQLWDLAFLAQAVVETGLANEAGNKDCVKGMIDWLDKAQIQDNPKHFEVNYRHRSKGAWGFSTPEQSYTVSDCSAEGLKAAIALQSLSFAPKPISLRRLQDCVDTILSMQNPNGGFCSYELQRGSEMMEILNASEVFGDIMVDYMYPECTTSALSALEHFRKLDPTYRAQDIDRTINAAIRWIHSVQRPDGSWYGSWGVCFTYATMFALESLAIAGETYANSERVRRACHFLVDKQKEDGGWGETYMSCVSLEYVQHEQSQVVMTSWALLALIYGQYPDKGVIERGAALIMSRQKADGRWDQEDTEGIFNKNCAIDYPSFKFIFCIWALGRADHYICAD